MTNTYNKSEIMKESWRRYRLFNGRKTWSECVKLSWMLAKIEAREETKELPLFELHNTATTFYRKGMNNRNQDTYKVVNQDSFNDIYKKSNSFVKKVMMSVAKNQNGIATSKQRDIIMNIA